MAVSSGLMLAGNKGRQLSSTHQQGISLVLEGRRTYRCVEPQLFILLRRCYSAHKPSR